MTAGGATGDQFGFSVASGDLNADGKVDLAVGADLYSSSTGRVYVFYGGSAADVSPSTADAIITGAAAGYRLGSALAVGDLNADGKVDLAVGSEGHTSGGRAYIFYNGSITTENATGADVNIAAEGSGDHLGFNMAMGDLNADGKNDVVIGANQYSSSTGRAYIFYGDGTIPTTAGTADVIITGESSSSFGTALATGDLNADGKVDLAVGAYSYSTDTGRAYIFYNDGSIPTTAATADVKFTGQATNESFGYSLATGDLNADGRVDLAAGSLLDTATGRVYIFYNDGSYPAPSAADVTIEQTDPVVMATFLKTGDLNADGKTDLVVSAPYDYPGGSVYVFYNDGSYPSLIDDDGADKKYNAGDSSGIQLGVSFDINDFNGDGINDLVAGAIEYSSFTGRTYTFITEIAPPQATAKTPDGNDISASLKAGTIKMKAGTIKVK